MGSQHTISETGINGVSSDVTFNVNDYFVDLDGDSLTWKINTSNELTISFSDTFTGWSQSQVNSYSNKYSKQLYANDGLNDSTVYVDIEITVEDPLTKAEISGLSFQILIQYFQMLYLVI